MSKLLLGSNSPRRNELMAQMGLGFTKVSINCNEDFSEEMDMMEVAAFLAEKKSNAYDHLQSGELLITADTTVVIHDTILNKPLNEIEARVMLESLSGGVHKVITGVALRGLDRGIEVFSSSTEVWVSELSKEEIDFYVTTYKPLDKAGAYGIQEWFGLTQVSRIEGCYYNVVGLPCNELFKRLSKYKIDFS
ncbi:Maf family protein [Bacteroidia bacterium]|nr:Maf family protein [Bacteroidia bacterium]MDC1395684.1 Maf family protein [Bacteroidia bacterium]